MVDSGPATPPTAPVVPLSRPGNYVGRIIVFLILCGIAAAFLQERIVVAFLANPVLNAVIVIALLAGIVLAFYSLWRVGREVRWANSRLRADAKPSRIKPKLLTPLEGVFSGTVRKLTPLNQRALLDSFEARLQESREILRYLAGLLVFLGLLGTFWGLLDTVRSIGGVIGSMRTSGSEAGTLFEDLKSGLAAPLAGMGISFSASLFGLAGSLVLGFLDLQVGRAHARFAAEVEDRLAPRISVEPEGGEPAALQGVFAALAELKQLVGAEGSSRATTQAMANLAEGIQALVKHMRSEQQMIRDWVEAQASRERKVERLLDRLASEPADRE
ncbi:MAG: flagellar motor protein MotA [Hyphomicrobiales bacterium]